MKNSSNISDIFICKNVANKINKKYYVNVICC